ncbi:MAG: hypothetical protein K2H73_00360, partial [Treponemataceae bacterium]|nr:hypothetical protein [Treponemataceae bacterium]
MARRQVFTPGEVKKKDDKFELRLLHEYAKPVVEEVVEETPVYTGPTVEELQKEADDFKAKWEAEKQQMLAAAQADADSIVERAKEAAFTAWSPQVNAFSAITLTHRPDGSVVADAPFQHTLQIDFIMSQAPL